MILAGKGETADGSIHPDDQQNLQQWVHDLQFGNRNYLYHQYLLDNDKVCHMAIFLLACGHWIYASRDDYPPSPGGLCKCRGAFYVPAVWVYRQINIRRVKALQQQRAAKSLEHHRAMKALREMDTRVTDLKEQAKRNSRRRTREKRAVAQALPPEDQDIADSYVTHVVRKRICEYCKIGPFEHVEHRQPLSRGGTGHWWNLASSCSSCNLRKGTKTEAEFKAILRRERRWAA